MSLGRSIPYCRARALVILAFLALASLFVVMKAPQASALNFGNSKAGNAYDAIYGDWEYSTTIQDGIVLSPGSGIGYATYTLTLPNFPARHSLIAQVYCQDTSAYGDGPHLRLWNWASSAWDNVVNLGVHTMRTIGVDVPYQTYVSTSGTVQLRVYADGNDDVDVGGVSAYYTTGSMSKNGDDANAKYGNWDYSSTYANGIELIDPSNAEWHFILVPDSVKYSLWIGVTYQDTSAWGDGLDLQYWNWGKSTWTTEFNIGAPTASTHLTLLISFKTNLIDLSGQYVNATTGLMKLRLITSLWDNTQVGAVEVLYTIDSPPTASFSVSPSSGNLATQFVFDASGGSDALDSSSSLQVRWDWENDGVWDTSWSTNKMATHTYSNAGSYLVNLEIEDSSGLTNQSTRQIFVVDDPPVTTAQLAGTAGENGWYKSSVTVTLTAYDDSGQLAWTKYKTDEMSNWASYSAPITISSEGVQKIGYFSQDSAGHSEAAKSMTISVDKTAPIAEGGADSTIDQASSVTLDGTSSSDNIGIASYSWSFVDGTTKTLSGGKPTYVFDNSGVFAITLTVSDEAGNRATDTVAITVLDRTNPVASVGSDRSVEVGIAASFDGSGSSDNVGIVSYEWDFGDGTTGTGKTTTHTYANKGIHTVTLTVKDAAGNAGTSSLTVTVNQNASTGSILVLAGIATATAVAVAAAGLLWWRRGKGL